MVTYKFWKWRKNYRLRKRLELENDETSSALIAVLRENPEVGKQFAEALGGFVSIAGKIKKYEIIDLLDKADKRDIDIPEGFRQSIISQDDASWITESAIKTIRQIEKEIRQKRRENIEWWITKVIVPMLGAITGLGGIIVAIIALWNKK